MIQLRHKLYNHIIILSNEDDHPFIDCFEKRMVCLNCKNACTWLVSIPPRKEDKQRQTDFENEHKNCIILPTKRDIIKPGGDKNDGDKSKTR
jgi:hypothetical protein